MENARSCTSSLKHVIQKGLFRSRKIISFFTGNYIRKNTLLIQFDMALFLITTTTV